MVIVRYCWAVCKNSAGGVPLAEIGMGGICCGCRRCRCWGTAVFSSHLGIVEEKSENYGVAGIRTRVLRLRT